MFCPDGFWSGGISWIGSGGCLGDDRRRLGVVDHRRRERLVHGPLGQDLPARRIAPRLPGRDLACRGGARPRPASDPAAEGPGPAPPGPSSRRTTPAITAKTTRLPRPLARELEESPRLLLLATLRDPRPPDPTGGAETPGPDSIVPAEIATGSYRPIADSSAGSARSGIVVDPTGGQSAAMSRAATRFTQRCHHG